MTLWRGTPCRRGWGVVMSLLMVVVTGCASADQSLLVDYFAGKDEICLTKDQASVTATPRRLILVVDFYGGSDREVYCTAILGRVDAPHEELRYSASQQNCEKLQNLGVADPLRLDVVEDHLCRIYAGER